MHLCRNGRAPYGDCPALNYAIELVEKVPVSGNPLVDARNAQVGSLADRSRTYHAETTFPTTLNIRIIVEVCHVLFLLTAFFSMQHGSRSSGDRPRGTDSPEVVKFLLYILIVLTKVPTARSSKPPPICLVETFALPRPVSGKCPCLSLNLICRTCTFSPLGLSFTEQQPLG